VGTNYEGTAKNSDYYLHYNHDPLFAAPPGVSYDTIYVFVKNDPFVEDTEQAYIRFRYESTNTSPDSVYTVNIVDRDTVQIGFLGAAFSFLENQGRCTIKLTTTSPMKTAFSVPVSFYNGNATPNLDFIFTDTIVTFPAFSMDTQEVYVTLLDDQLDEPNEQINLRIGDLTPANIGKEGTRQFSLFIIDNDSTVLSINETNEGITTSVYPNPLSNWLRISSSVAIEQLQIVGIDGKIVFAAELNKEENITLNTVDWSSGIYIVHITTQEGVKSIRIVKN
jgi:hypothetical protein